MCLLNASLTTLPLYPHPLLLLASGALEGMAQTLPLKHLNLDWCCLGPRQDGNHNIMATIGTMTTLKKLSLRGSNFGDEARQVSGLLSLACLLMTSPAV